MQRLAGDAVLGRQKDTSLVRIGAVAIAAAQGMRSLIADIRHRYGKRWRDRTLNAEIPCIQSWQSQAIRPGLHVDGVAGRRQEAIIGDGGEHVWRRAVGQIKGSRS